MRPLCSVFCRSFWLRFLGLVLWTLTLNFATLSRGDDGPELRQLVQAIKQVDRFGVGHSEASAAAAQLSRLPASRIPEVLRSMNELTPLTANWFRAAVEACADRDPNAVSVEELNGFLADRTQGTYARSLAFDLIVDRRPEVKEELIAGFMDDPCLELRFMAIDRGMVQAKAAADAQQSESATSAYTTLLEHARNPEQINAIADALEKLGSPVDLTKHYGFITSWSLIGPFDNREKIGFDSSYGPETSVDLSAPVDGKEGAVSWAVHETTLPFGMIDLNTAVGKHMGAVAYAYATVTVAEETTLDVRLGTPNGNKVWVNGELVISNHVYHAGNAIDQHRASVTLKPGKNELLVKICQNEQTDSWAQDWQFQLRLTDASGKAIVLPE